MNLSKEEMERRTEMLNQMDALAYASAGALAAIVKMHAGGQIKLEFPNGCDDILEIIKLLVSKMESFRAQYNAINAIDKAMEKE